MGRVSSPTNFEAMLTNRYADPCLTRFAKMSLSSSFLLRTDAPTRQTIRCPDRFEIQRQFARLKTYILEIANPRAPKYALSFMKRNGNSLCKLPDNGRGWTVLTTNPLL